MQTQIRKLDQIAPLGEQVQQNGLRYIMQRIQGKIVLPVKLLKDIEYPMDCGDPGLFLDDIIRRRKLQGRIKRSDIHIIDADALQALNVMMIE